MDVQRKNNYNNKHTSGPKLGWKYKGGRCWDDIEPIPYPKKTKQPKQNTVFRPTVLPFVPEQNHEFRPTLGPFVPKASKIEITKPKQDKMKKPQTVKVDIEDTDSDSYSESNSYSNSDSNSDTDSEINENNEVITEVSDSCISLEIDDSDLFNWYCFLSI